MKLNDIDMVDSHHARDEHEENPKVDDIDMDTHDTRDKNRKCGPASPHFQRTSQHHLNLCQSSEFRWDKSDISTLPSPSKSFLEPTTPVSAPKEFLYPEVKTYESV
jgi:hypothetical protein